MDRRREPQPPPNRERSRHVATAQPRSATGKPPPTVSQRHGHWPVQSRRTAGGHRRRSAAPVARPPGAATVARRRRRRPAARPAGPDVAGPVRRDARRVARRSAKDRSLRPGARLVGRAFGSGTAQRRAVRHGERLQRGLWRRARALRVRRGDLSRADRAGARSGRAGRRGRGRAGARRSPASPLAPAAAFRGTCHDAAGSSPAVRRALAPRRQRPGDRHHRVGRRLSTRRFEEVFCAPGHFTPAPSHRRVGRRRETVRASIPAPTAK